MKKKTERQEPLKILAGRPDWPLRIGDIEIPCYVLEGEIRVITQGGLLTAIGRSRTPRQKTIRSSHVVSLPVFLSSPNLKPFINKRLIKLADVVDFRPTTGGHIAHGYRAELLPLLCNVYLEARSKGVLHIPQQHIAERAEILVMGLATVGIIALIDEVTGYQRLRAELALKRILDDYIAQEFHPWTKTFGLDFSLGIARLRGWEPSDQGRFPRAVAGYINDLVYARLEQGVLDELRKKNPMLSSKRRKVMHHQWLTRDIGHPRLREHISTLLAFMRAAPNWGAFKRNVQRAFPVQNETLHLPLDEE